MFCRSSKTQTETTELKNTMNPIPFPSPIRTMPDSLPPEPRKRTDESRVGLWTAPVVVAPNNFVYKSLSNWAVNIAVGCSHACRFCYVPSAATIKQKPKLAQYGVTDPDEEWGDYVLLRPWDEQKFRRSLTKAQNTPTDQLRPDGNRAIFYCSTTDPYQVFRHPDSDKRKELGNHAQDTVAKSLELIRDHSTLNVRILTRSPLARIHFDLFRSFGDRLLFGMSLPTLNNSLSKVYEPRAPSPSQRLATLAAAKEAGLNIYVAVAPTYPECDSDDIHRTLSAVQALEPLTVFHEPINIRAENVQRIEAHANSLGITLNTSVFRDRQSWIDYALRSLKETENVAQEQGLSNQLHLWPDKSLGAQKILKSMTDPNAHLAWLNKWWHRISEWPGNKRV